MWSKYDILKIWREKAENVRGVAFDCGHFLSEEDPQRTAAELLRFLQQYFGQFLGFDLIN